MGAVWCAVAGEAHAAGKTRVAVLDFVAQGLEPGEARSLLANIGDIVTSEVAKLGYDVVSTADINAMLSYERQKDMVGCADDTSCLAEIGGALGADLLLRGAVGKMGDQLSLSMGLVDSKSAQVKQHFQGSAGGIPALVETARRGVRIVFGREQDASGLATLFVRTEPSGAAIQLDGKDAGVSPLTLDDIPAGDHLLVARKEDLTARLAVHLAPEAVERVSLRLEGAPPVKLKVLSTPGEAEVLLDGVKVGVTPVLLSEVRSGRHVVEVRLASYTSDVREVTLDYEAFDRGGRVPFKHEAKLVPLPVELRVAGLPVDAQVTIDGAPAAANSRCLPGKHMMRVAAHGHRPLAQEIEIAPGADRQIDVSLEVLPEYRDFLARRDRKHLWRSATGGATAALALLGGGTMVWASVTHRRAQDAFADYKLASDGATIQARYEDVEKLTGQARAQQAVGWALVGTAALSAALCAYSWLTVPADPLAPVAVGVGVSSSSSTSVLLQLQGAF